MTVPNGTSETRVGPLRIQHRRESKGEPDHSAADRVGTPGGRDALA
jgi:hypothetical protein